MVPLTPNLEILFWKTSRGKKGMFSRKIPWGDNIKAVTISGPKTGEAHNFVGNRSTMLKLSGIIRPFIDRKMGEFFFQQMLFFGQFWPIFEIC